ncbi:hypothetical protein N6H13_03845 [Paenibacillus sp. CC-CFT742]|nr:hypothetical protein [Paenibacillus sp. CC-CFT742]WJH29889.1 hypothetical protein N6H13_03845 [Paenibacillus sp. CC-CFT742]
MTTINISSSMGRLTTDGFGVFDDMNSVPGFEGNQGGFFRDLMSLGP